MFTEPVVGKAFFGREDILSILEKRVNALTKGFRQNVALTGQMLAGKSSILHQFLSDLKKSTLIPIYLEVVEEPFTSFANKFIATLLHNYMGSLGGTFPNNDLIGLIKTAKSQIPRTASAIKRITNDLLKKDYTLAYQKLLNLTSILKEETGKSCVVILDEFHNMEHFKIKKPYLYFGKIMMVQKDTMYIVSSSQRNTIKKILSEKLALLYGNFEIIEVSGFDDKTARAFLHEKFQNITARPPYINFITAFTDNNPFYIDVISKKIIEIANSQKLGSLSESLIIEAFTALLHSTNGTINQYFTNNIMELLDKNLRKDYLDLLIALSCGSNKLTDIAAWFGKKNTSGFTAKLDRLIALDMIYKNGVFYELQDRVFKFWLKTVYYKKKVSLVDDILRRTDDFKNEVSEELSGYLTESHLNVAERVKELFSLFDGETVEIEKKQRRLPKFVKIELQKYRTHYSLITKQKTNKYWICEIWENRIGDFEISNFIKNSRIAKEKKSKKVCITLNGIDANALLLAKEKNVWVWDLKKVNTLLRIYKKHDLQAI